jgi:hypothetical protein
VLNQEIEDAEKAEKSEVEVAYGAELNRVPAPLRLGGG